MSETPAPAVQDHYPEDFAHCYGCGRLNEHGLHVQTRWEGDGTVARFTPRPYHAAVPGYVYGGLLASLVDCHAMATASAATVRASGRQVGEGEAPRFVTGSLRVDYLLPTPLGPELELRGRVRRTDGRRVTVEVTVAAGGQVTAQGEVLAVLIPQAMTAPPRP
ncbi:MAG TPA: PaaI family thioesterase [Longimicrobiaceae bacterium]|nr:PaaI family thioesterase [Longimicrobiaceae bacterium]